MCAMLMHKDREVTVENVSDAALQQLTDAVIRESVGCLLAASGN